jgi:DNA-binding MarR family transcriptional regulator
MRASAKEYLRLSFGEGLILLGGAIFTVLGFIQHYIAHAVEVDQPAATVGVDKLEARGLDHRTPHPDDNRRKLVHLTDAGRDAAQIGQAILNEPPPALTNLDSDDLARLDEILTRLQANRRPL